MTSGEDRRTSGTFQCDLKPGTRNGRYRLEHMRRSVWQEPNDDSGWRSRGRWCGATEIAMVACVAGRRVGRSLVGCRVCVSAAMANDRKRVDRRSCRTRRLSTPQGGVQGDHGDRHYPQEPSEACTHALLGPRSRSYQTLDAASSDKFPKKCYRPCVFAADPLSL